MQTSELLNNYNVDPRTWDEMYSSSTVREQYKGVVDFLRQKGSQNPLADSRLVVVGSDGS